MRKLDKQAVRFPESVTAAACRIIPLEALEKIDEERTYSGLPYCSGCHRPISSTPVKVPLAPGRRPVHWHSDCAKDAGVLR